MSYKKDLNKIYRKIDTISKKGKDGVFDFYTYIDQLIANSQYIQLEDVMRIYYDINIKKYQSIDDFKKLSYTFIREKTSSSFQKKLKDLLEQKNVYQIGFNFYDSVNNHYLGDIKESDSSESWIAYRDPNLKQIEDEIKVIRLEVAIGISQSMSDTIPIFANDNNEVEFGVNDLIRYDGLIYECISAYTYSMINRVTPTYSSYWTNVYSPTYSLTIIDDSNLKLIDKYSMAIDIVKGNTYSFVLMDA